MNTCKTVNEADDIPISSREELAREIEVWKDDECDLKEPRNNTVGYIEVVKNDGTSELAIETTDAVECLYNEIVDNEIDGSIDEELFKKMKNALINKRLSVVSDQACDNNETNMQTDSAKETTVAEITGERDNSKDDDSCTSEDCAFKPEQKIDVATMTFECEKCEKVFSSKSALKRHLSMHTGSKPYQCGECDQRFAAKAYLVRHIQTHTGARRFCCEICGKGFARRATLTVHLDSHTDVKKYACDQCDKMFKLKGSMTAHKNVHTPEKMLVCHLCGKSFSSRGYLQQHLRSHSESASFECELCQKTFTSKQSMEEHARRHIGEKSYICKLCSKRFYNSKELNLHMKYHNTETDYKCNICDMYFRFEKSLLGHQSRIHGQHHTCKHCSEKFSSKRSLESHMYRNHKDKRPQRKGTLEKKDRANFKKVPCPHCGKMLSNKYRLRHHVMSKHGKRFKIECKKNLGSSNMQEIAMQEKQEVLSMVEEILERKDSDCPKAVIEENVIRATSQEAANHESVVVIYETGVRSNIPQLLQERQQRNISSTSMQNNVQYINTIPSDSETDRLNSIMKHIVYDNEVIVVVNNTDDGSTELHREYHNFEQNTDEGHMINQVAEEVVIQPVNEDSAAVASIVESTDDLTGGLKKEDVGHFSEDVEDLDVETEVAGISDTLPEDSKAGVVQETVAMEQSVLASILPQAGTVEEFSKFQNELIGGVRRLRNFDQYGQFINTILEFAQAERNLLNP